MPLKNQVVTIVFDQNENILMIKPTGSLAWRFPNWLGEVADAEDPVIFNKLLLNHGFVAGDHETCLLGDYKIGKKIFQIFGLRLNGDNSIFNESFRKVEEHAFFARSSIEQAINVLPSHRLMLDRVTSSG